MPLLSDLRGSGGAHYLYDLLDAPGAGVASGAGVDAAATASDATVFTGTAGDASGAGVSGAATASDGSALGYAIVTIALPIFNGPGSIFYGYGESWGNFEGTPQAGDTVRYPTTNGFRILSDGTVEADEYGTYTYFYDDGTGEVERSIVLDASAQVFAAGASAAAEAANASLYGGVNVSGAGTTAAATPAAGTATAGNIATGQGASATATSSAATVAAGAAASGAGVDAAATPADAVAETVTGASGAGAEATASAAEGSASGDVIAVGAGVTVGATAAAAIAQGDLTVGHIPLAVLTVVYPSQIPFAMAA